jgi:hypothetical protein
VSTAGFETPEAAALAEWDAYPSANVRVVETRYKNKSNAIVITDTDPTHPMKNYVERTDAGWVLVGDSN